MSIWAWILWISGGLSVAIVIYLLGLITGWKLSNKFNDMFPAWNIKGR